MSFHRGARTDDRETPRRHVRRLSEWQQLIDEQARSGQSKRAFCAARALSAKSFWWSAARRDQLRPEAGLLLRARDGPVDIMDPD